MIIRNATPDDAHAIANVQVLSWRAAYRGLIDDAYLAAMSVPERATHWERWFTHEAPGRGLLVAELDDGHVVGFVAAGPERSGVQGYDGEIYALYLLTGNQGRGIGHALVDEAVRGLIAAGMRSMLAWVLADNPSKGFYERLGGVLIAQQQIEIGGKQYDEIAYGWPDIGGGNGA